MTGMFRRSWKTWKSHDIFKWLFTSLEQSFENNSIPKVLEKSQSLYSYVHLC